MFMPSLYVCSFHPLLFAELDFLVWKVFYKIAILLYLTLVKILENYIFRGVTFSEVPATSLNINSLNGHFQGFLP